MLRLPIHRLLAASALSLGLVSVTGCSVLYPEDASVDMPMPESAAQTDSDMSSDSGMMDDSEMASEDSASGLPELVQIKLTEFGIESTHSSFQTGVPYRFVILNEGLLAHDLRLTPRGEAESMVAMNMGSEPHSHGTELIYVPEADLGPGVFHTTDLTFFQPGELEIACHVNGHFEAGMWQAIEVIGEVMATPTPIDPDSIIYDPNMMPEAPCHVMGTTIMGQCTEEDLAAIKAQLLGASGENDHGHESDTPDEHGHDEAGEMMDDEGHMEEGEMAGDEGSMMGDDEHGDEAGEDGGDDAGGDDSGSGSGSDG